MWNSETSRARDMIASALGDQTGTASGGCTGEIEIKAVQAVQFGLGARAHHLLQRGYFVSGTCDSNVSPAATAPTSGGIEKCIATRAEAAKETDNGSSFPEHRFTLLIAELWHCRQGI